MANEFETMKEIGKLFGVSSRAVGKKLKELGFRTADGRPSSEAFALQLVQQHFADDGEHYLWAWSVGKTVPLLEKAGLMRKA
jgi:hypothetical protein